MILLAITVKWMILKFYRIVKKKGIQFRQHHLIYSMNILFILRYSYSQHKMVIYIYFLNALINVIDCIV